jgi:hypothetical protein
MNDVRTVGWPTVHIDMNKTPNALMNNRMRMRTTLYEHHMYSRKGQCGISPCGRAGN